MRQFMSVLTTAFLLAAVRAEADTRVPLTIRMKNPCALSWGYKESGSRSPTEVFWLAQEHRIPVSMGDHDSRGNIVMKFSSDADGERICKLFLQGELYAALTVRAAIRKWDGGSTWVGYANYVVRRSGIKPSRRMASLSSTELDRFYEAQREWESGRTTNTPMAASTKAATQKNGKVKPMPPREVSLNAWNDAGLAKENAAIARYGLTRFQDQAQLGRAIQQGLVERIPDRGRGYRLAPLGGHARMNRVYYKYARPFTARLIKRLGDQYRALGGREFEYSSLVRDCVYQRRIAKSGNRNATSCEKTSHTAGTSFDIPVRTVATRLRPWIEGVFLDLERKGLVQFSLETQPRVYHVMVFPPYMDYRPGSPAPVAQR